MKTIIFFAIFLFFFSSNLFCQAILYDSLYRETTVLNKEEKKVFDHIVKVYLENKIEKVDCEDCFGYVLDVFPKIDSLQRFYYVSETKEKLYVASKLDMVVGKEERGYFGDKVTMTFNPDISLEHCYVDMHIIYPAAGVSEAQITFVVNKDIYETYRYFTNSGGGYEVYSFKVNGIEKYKGERQRPYEIFLY
jgi:hypothetical protein